MKQEAGKNREKNRTDTLFRALSSIYTGIFCIDLEKDEYEIVHSPKVITDMLHGIVSAQNAINSAIHNTVFRNELPEVLNFVNLATLPERMRAETDIGIEYKGSISGWVKGSFIEAGRDENDRLTRVLYVYRVVEEEKKKDLETYQQLKDNYARAEKDVEEKKYLEKETNKLKDKNELLTNQNEELQKAQNVIHTILNAGSYVCTYARDGESLVSIKFSDALRQLYGYADEDDAPDTWDMWLEGAHPEDRERVAGQYQAALKDRTANTSYSVTYRAMKKDGTVRWHRAIWYMIRREDGTVEFCYGFVMDIDEQKKASDMLEDALKEAKLANAAKTSFLTRMSHDIRTPMNAIMGLIDINEKHADDIAFTTKNRHKARVAAKHLLSLINDVLQLSKLENSDIQFLEKPFNMLDLLDDIFTITEMRANENGIDLQMNVDSSVCQATFLWGSSLHVRQIYINILGNSIKYNKKHGSVTCDASAWETDPEHVMFKMVIKDTGIGMSEAFLQHLFDPFTREHEESGEKYEGTGLGLSIVKQLVDKMGGSIQVESEVDKGSCFTVEIPFKKATEEDVRELEESETEANIEGRNILLVEDNEINMDIAETMLTDAGAHITKAVNGQQAVDLFNGNPPGTFDLILMDVMMPVMNGYEATKCIRSSGHSDAKEIPIIAMTANAFMEDIEKAKKSGMNDHLAKPIEIHKMLTAIAKCTKD